MNKFKLWHLAVICVAVFLIFGVLATVIILNNDGLHDINKWNFNWNGSNFGIFSGSSKDYTIDADNSIDVSDKSKISIKGISAEINIVQTSGNELKAHLYGDYSSRNGEIELEVQNTGSTTKITVKYPNHGVVRSNLTLDIELPSNYSDDISVTSVSGDIDFQCDDMLLGDVSIGNVSGTTQLNTLRAEGVSVNTVSGNVRGNLTSGSLEVSGVSSKVEVSGLASSVKITTVSGDATLWIEKYDDIKVSTTSGDVQINLEVKDDFYVNFNSVSGKFECSVPLTIVRQKRNDFEGYSGDDYSAKFDVGSVSGDLTINQ